MTSATSAWRGSHSFGAFAAGKHGARALSQSIAREYGPKGVHVCCVIIDGTIITKRTKILFGARKGEGWMNDEGQRLSPDSIAKNYIWLHQVSERIRGGCRTTRRQLIISTPSSKPGMPGPWSSTCAPPRSTSSGSVEL